MCTRFMSPLLSVKFKNRKSPWKMEIIEEVSFFYGSISNVNLKQGKTGTKKFVFIARGNNLHWNCVYFLLCHVSSHEEHNRNIDSHFKVNKYKNKHLSMFKLMNCVLLLAFSSLCYWKWNAKNLSMYLKLMFKVKSP